MIEFAPRKRRVAEVRLTDYPNTLTFASLEREAARRVADGYDAAEAALQCLEGVQRWRRADLPHAHPPALIGVDLGSGRPYTYRVQRQSVVVGDQVRVPGIAGETVGTVTALNVEYDGPVKAMYCIEKGVYGVTYSPAG